MDISCRKTTCKMNKKNVCVADDIHVSSHMECKTFIKDRSKKPKDTSKDMFETAHEAGPFRHNKTIDIGCRAPCLFNKKGKCLANGITVNEIAKEPLCITYIKK